MATAISEAAPPETESRFLFLSEGIVTVMVMVVEGWRIFVDKKRLKVERREKKLESMSMQLSRTGDGVPFACRSRYRGVSALSCCAVFYTLSVFPSEVSSF